MSNPTASTDLKKTPLYDDHVKAEAKVIDFGGWLMPVQYTGIMDEHHAVRNGLGVFDISHMGELIVTGPQAKAYLNHVLTNNVEKLAVGECHYTFLLNDNGGIIDDLIVYQYADGEFLLVVNASKIDEDYAWLKSHLRDGVSLENKSDEYGGLAIQGPKAAQLFDKFFHGKYSRPARNQIIEIEVGSANVKMLIARTGYTGEDGFELFFPAAYASRVWNEILEAGAEFGIKPCGLGARDTLRLEMCYPLNGSDLSTDYTPLEAGMSFFVDLSKPDFIGRSVLADQKEHGVKRRLVPFKMVGKSPPPRSHYGVYKNGVQIAETTSGSLSPSLGIGIGMAYLPTEFARINEEVEIDIRGRRFPAIIEKKPLHRKN